jgi:glycine dehydrogenase subunit 1
MGYIPNISQKEQMLKEIGLSSMDELFSDIPDEIRINSLALPEALSEYELRKDFNEIVSANKPLTEISSFLGAGVYHHTIPAFVSALINRSEFYSCYTPYQPELSQGMLQALFEYQSLVAELTAMDAANTSMYDAPTALGEAALMSVRITRKNEFIIPKAMHWDKLSVLKNYIKWVGIKIKEIPYLTGTGTLDLDALKNEVNENTAGVYVENPNFFGVFEDSLTDIKELIGKALLVVGVNPISLGMVKPPGEFGADIVIGEFQELGSPPSFGGPLNGLFACKKEYIRKMPGRIIGLTQDTAGRQAFCMTLQTREQYIRREKATSNICTNEALCALASAIHLGALGKSGLKELSKQNLLRGHYLATQLGQITGVSAPLFKNQHFNEFVIKLDGDSDDILAKLRGKNILGGVPLKPHFPELGEAILVATTEVHSGEEYNNYISTLKQIMSGGSEGQGQSQSQVQVNVQNQPGGGE